MKKISLVALALIVMFGLSGAGSSIIGRISENLAAVLPAVVALVTNNARAADNLGALKVNAELTAAAEAKANDMASKSYFAHTSPDGKLPWYWFEKAGYKYEYAGENLAVNFEDSNDVVKAWLNSPTHRFNIMRREYTEIGVGTASGTYKGHPATFVVQMFASPAK